MQMKETISQALYSYWNGLRGTRLAPKRFEIEPSCIAGFLPDTFILEHIDRNTLRFRLAGTRICEAFGAELRGMNLFELFDEADRPALERQVSLVTSNGAVGVFEISAGNGKGLSAAFEVLLMPLTHMRDRIDRFLGSIAPIDKPNWLGSVPLEHRKLESHYLIWPDGRPQAVIDAMHRQIPLLPTVREAKIVKAHRRQFRVYEGGLSRLGDER
jgi:hypothetical protein